MSLVEQEIYGFLIILGLVSAGAVFVALFFVAAPYGRYSRPGWGPTVSPAAGWVLMELPAVVVFAGCFLVGTGGRFGPAWVFLLLWETHYIYRTFVFPLRLRSSGKHHPLAVVGMALAFNMYNAYLNGRYLGAFADQYAAGWLWDPRFLAGLALFLSGLAVNIHSDNVLRKLRKPGEAGYKVPHGGLFQWVSCPNYLGELVEWTGWALLTWSLPGLVFAIWTGANLTPRAYHHHRWYRAHLPNYPMTRRALIPFVF